MRTIWRTVALSLLASVNLGLLIAAAPSGHRDAEGVVRFATLPPGAPAHPEGLAADGSGNIYAASFELIAAGATAAMAEFAEASARSMFPPQRRGLQAEGVPSFTHNNIYVFAANGRLKTTTAMPAQGTFGAPVVPLGIVVKGAELFVNDVFNGDVLRYALPLQPLSQPVATYHICGGFVSAFFDPDNFCALNSNAAGPDGRIYISDNGAGRDVVEGAGAAFQDSMLNGRIFVLDPATGTSSLFFDSADLDVGGADHGAAFPEFGVNGIAFAPNGAALYMANMSTDVIYKLTLSGCASRPSEGSRDGDSKSDSRSESGSESRSGGRHRRPSGPCVPGSQSVFVPAGREIDGPDNMDFDDHGTLWVASGQDDTVVGIRPSGRIIKKVGSFEGFSRDGAPKGLLQPSGIAFSRGKIYIGNEANQSLRQDPIDWDALQLWTISRINP